MGTITFATLWGNTMAAMTAVAEGAQASLTSFMHNATTYVGEIIGTHASQISGQELYAGVNVAQLNTFERLWMSYYQSFDNPVVATGIMSFLIHELVYFGRSLPWMAIDAMPYFNKWKLQETKVPTWEQQWACTKYVLATHFTVELPQIYLFHPMATYFGMETWQVPFPSPLVMAAQITLFFFMEDTWHYWAHRLMHHRRLYKYVHKIHHEYSAPFGLAAEYAHPIEVLVLGTGTVGSPLLYCALNGGGMHIITMYIWIVLRLFQAIDAHSGYQFPWSLNVFFPLWAGADHHDFHHQAFTNCYSTSFRHWDWMLGTDTSYHSFRAKQRAEKVAKQAPDVTAQPDLKLE